MIWMPSSRFQAALPADAVKGAGTRTNIVSFLAMARNPFTVPVYKTEPFDLGCRLTGFEGLPKTNWKSTRMPLVSWIELFRRAANII